MKLASAATKLLRQMESAATSTSLEDNLMMVNPLTLHTVEARLNSWLHPDRFGEAWDNIGLLIGSEKEKEQKIIRKILLCNDLTLGVVEEAIGEKTDMIIAYHPPIFKPLKSIAYSSWKERVVAKCLAHDIVVYSPHTTLDSVPGGMNDSFVKILGRLKALHDVRPIKSKFEQSLPRVSFVGHPSIFSEIYQRMVPAKHFMFGFQLDKAFVEGNDLGGEGELIIACESDITLRDVSSENILERPASDFGSVFNSVTSSHSTENGNGMALRFWPGAGRIVTLQSPAKLFDVVNAIKADLNLPYVQVAGVNGDETMVTTFAICVGSGASLFMECPEYVDCMITGEMSHHEILDIVNTKLGKKSLILIGHCNSERHYLPTLVKVLHIILKGFTMPEIKIAQADKAPLCLA